MYKKFSKHVTISTYRMLFFFILLFFAILPIITLMLFNVGELSRNMFFLSLEQIQIKQINAISHQRM